MEIHDHKPPIIVYAIGVGENIDPDELLAIASGEELLNISSFDENELDSIRDGYTYQICFTGKRKLSIYLGLVG